MKLTRHTVLKEGYRQGLKAAQRIIKRMINERNEYDWTVDDLPESCYKHLGNRRVDPKIVVQDLISANLFDMETVGQAAAELERASYFDSPEEYNELFDTDYTWDDFEQGDVRDAVLLSSVDGIVTW